MIVLPPPNLKGRTMSHLFEVKDFRGTGDPVLGVQMTGGPHPNPKSYLLPPGEKTNHKDNARTRRGPTSSPSPRKKTCFKPFTKTAPEPKPNAKPIPNPKSYLPPPPQKELLQIFCKDRAQTETWSRTRSRTRADPEPEVLPASSTPQKDCFKPFTKTDRPKSKPEAEPDAEPEAEPEVS